MTEDTLREELAAKTRECDSLRDTLSRCVSALGNGSVASANCSTEFFAALPDEIAGVIAVKSRALETAERELKRVKEKVAELLSELECDEQPTLLASLNEIGNGIQSERDFHEEEAATANDYRHEALNSASECKALRKELAATAKERDTLHAQLAEAQAELLNREFILDAIDSTLPGRTDRDQYEDLIGVVKQTLDRLTACEPVIEAVRELRNMTGNPKYQDALRNVLFHVELPAKVTT